MARKITKSADTGRITSPHPDDTATHRWCPECEAWLLKREFYTDRRAKSGLTRRCRVHHSRKSYESRLDHPQHNTPSKRYAYNRARRLAEYGLTLETYAAKLAAQDGRCAICGRPAEDDKSDGYGLLPVDHCHETGITRDLLCTWCNTGLGKFLHSVELLRAAADYLERHRGLPDVRPAVRPDRLPLEVPEVPLPT